MATLTRTSRAAIALAFTAALVAPLPAHAQALYGSIVGNVVDSQGAGVPAPR